MQPTNKSNEFIDPFRVISELLMFTVVKVAAINNIECTGTNVNANEKKILLFQNFSFIS